MTALHHSARPSLADLGLTRVARAVVCGECLLVIGCAALYPQLGLHFVWKAAAPAIAAIAAPWIAWLYFVWQPGRSRIDWVIAERFLVVGVLFATFLIHPQAQYVAFALKRPLVSLDLVAIDRWIGLEVPDFIGWSARHPHWLPVFRSCYQTLLLQFGIPIVALWASPRDRDDLWEYVALFSATSVVALLCVALWPAEPPTVVYPQITPLLNQSRVAQQIAGLRGGLLTAVDVRNLDGLISFPSFHVIGAMIATWALRHKPVVREVLIVTNIGLVAATLVLGLHYLVDVIAGAGIAGAAILVSRQLHTHE